MFHAFHGIEGVVLTFGKVVDGQFPQILAWPWSSKCTITNYGLPNYVSITKGIMTPNVVTTMVIPNNILISGNNNVSGTIAESGGVSPSINGLWWHLILLWNYCDNCIKEITKKFGHKVMGFIRVSI